MATKKTAPEVSPDEEESVSDNDLFEICGRNVDAEEDGVWVPLVLNERTTDILLGLKSFRSSAGKRYTKLRDRFEKTARHAGRFKGKEMPDDVLREGIAQAIVQSGLLFGWKNLKIGAAGLVEFSKEKALEILTDPKFDVFAVAIINMAASLDTFKQGVAEETEKN